MHALFEEAGKFQTGRLMSEAEASCQIELDSGKRVLAMVPSHHDHALGERIGIRLDVDHVVTFPPAP